MRAKSLAISLGLGLSIALTGCDELLTETPKDFITEENFFRTPADLDAAAQSMYTQWYDWNAFRAIHIWITELASDEARVNPSEPNYSTSHPDFLGWTSGDGTASAPWNTWYAILSRANTVLDNADRVEFSNPQQKAALLGEAKFMRGLSYFWLARFYGGVPLILSQEDALQKDVPRASEAEVIAQVIQDAEAAANDLPLTRSGTEVGRATKGAALALLADAYMWRASAMDGGQADWQKVAENAKKVMDLGVYSLTPDYYAAFDPAKKNGPEEIFSAQAVSTPGGQTSTCMSCSYYPRELGFEQGGGWGVVQPTEWMYESYLPGDYRHEVTFRTEGCSVNANIGCIELSYPHVWKYRQSNGGVPQWEGDNNVPIYRYAEILLMYAEAQNELGNTAEAVRYLNMVRERARNGSGAEERAEPHNYGTKAGEAVSQSAVREAIYMERLWELSFEMKRWFDLVRAGTDYFVSQLTAHDPNARSSGNVDANRMRLPIPAGELQLNSALEQNPGY